MILWLAACGAVTPAPVVDTTVHAPAADVIAVTTTGAPGGYDVAVTLRSDETGCDRYADWWEVLDGDGHLLYRRILEHSHPNEQPFDRDGGPVAVQPDQPLVVRAHLSTHGYAGAVLKGSIAGGFTAWTPPADFARAVERQGPQPTGCLF